MSESKQTHYNKYQKDRYSRIVILKDTHKRIQANSKKEGKDILKYVDEIIPDVSD